ncbi:MAG: glutaredoxin family protein [Bradyrhizobium sp.]|uniref:glutaredoxin family protein n=1 Tax=Bradyrhizobium sp. TaxID=376 RepID=UPI00348F5341
MIRLSALSSTRLRIALVIVLGLIFAALQLTANVAPSPESTSAWQHDGRLHVFFHPDCPHCHRAIEFLRTQPRVDFVLHDVSNSANEALFLAIARQHAIPENELGVPLFVRGSRYLLGFESAEKTGRDLLALVADETAIARPEDAARKISLPWLGDIDPVGYSLPTLGILMGLADGFNPCAMWVLVYLISLIAGIKDYGKIWWLVGSFVLASGVLYFLFMTAWLNTFLVVGHIRPLTQIVGLVAIGIGIDHLYELAVTRGVTVCDVGNTEQRQQTMQRIRKIVAAPVGLVSLLLIVGLAFTVNAIEFACSAALPAIYTHMLALADLSTGAYYAYIGLYVTFFMLDDLVIFGLAAFTVQKVIDTRYAALSRGAGGVVLIGLGLWMLAR